MSNAEVRGPKDFLADGGETGKLMRSLDWSTTALPPPQHWPQSLRLAISICLGSSFPIAVYWGRDFTILYNDAYIPIAGGKHPWALGRPGREVWPEIWDTVGPMFENVVTTGEADGGRDQLLPLRRHGYFEECYFDYTLTPIRGESNRVDGIFNAAIEATYRVISERRGRVLRDLAERTSHAQSVDNACALAIEALAAARKDVPFCLVYLLDPGGHHARLAGSAGVAPGSPASPTVIDVTTEQHMPPGGVWPITRAAMSGHIEVVDDLGGRFGAAPSCQAWPEPCASAAVVPIMSAIREDASYGFLIAGVSPRRALDDDYRGFFDLVAERIAIAIGNARERELRAEIATEHSRAALHESEARLAYALEAGRLGSWDLDMVTGVSIRSAAHDRIFGYREPVADWTYKTFMQHVLPDDRDHVDRSSRLASAQRAHWHVECRIRRTDGEVRWIEIHGSPQGTTAAGGAARFSGVVQDITERKQVWEHEQRAQRLEGEIRVSEEKYRLLWEKAHDAILVLDQNGIVLEANRTTETISGLSHDDIVGRSLFRAATEPEQEQRLRKLLASDQAGTTQLRLSGGGGKRFDVEVSATRISADGQDLVLFIARDVTQRLLLEQQLRQSQKMDAIGQLTGGVAHDFNNILTVITGSIDLLVDDLADSPHLAAVARMIGEAATRAANLIGQLLAFARKQALQPHDTDINRLIIDTTRLLRPTLGEAIEINAMLGEDCWHAMIDPSQLSTALLNLAVNARDAMPKGGKLTFGSANVIFDDAFAEANPEVKPGAYVKIFVTDSGTGIPRAIRDRVFEPFFTTKAVGKGTGLGLSMVYGFVKQSGGHIKISSEEGQGTTIEIHLPRSGEAAATSEASAASAPQGGHETILVVEDDPLVRHYAVTQLQSLGYATISAAMGPEALGLVDRGAKFDVLFTDVIMPGGMNGRQLADEIAKLRPGIPVLFTSGYSESAIAHNGQLDPEVALLAKPYRKPDLARMICEALARRAGPTAA